MTLLFKVLENLPPPPKKIIDQADLSSRPTSNELGRYTQRWLVNWGNAAPKAGQNLRMKFLEFENWVKSNIHHNIVDAGINYVSIDPVTDRLPMSTGGHTDKIRNYVLLFPILQGGVDTRLTFWQEKDHPIVRPPATDAEDGNKLKMLDFITLPENKWTLTHTNVLHSVENLSSTRINLQISLLYNPWENEMFHTPGKISIVEEEND